MRATTITNLASLEHALTNVNGALMAIEMERGNYSQLCDGLGPMSCTMTHVARNPDGAESSTRLDYRAAEHMKQNRVALNGQR